MRRSAMLLGFTVVLALALGVSLGTVLGQGGEVEGPDQVIASEVEGDNRRVIYGPAGGISPASPDAVDISFIDSPTAFCYQPDPAQDVCYVNFAQHYVTSAPNYMIQMSMTLASRVQAVYQGFFQDYMLVNHAMHGQGFKVSCGELGTGGKPLLGNAYSWIVRARDSSNLKSANYGTVYCPAYVP
ncbi:MAG: hypothetical protein JXC32_05240 [Anaerolineae bacterium]|nr:hypothetical protein [Anaerolineae bacterium]